VQYIQNTINKAEIEKIKNNHKVIDADMRTMPIRSESNQINTIKQKKSKKCEGPGQPVLLGPPKCEHDMKYDEI